MQYVFDAKNVGGVDTTAFGSLRVKSNAARGAKMVGQH